jgi:hypothetical protein
MEFPNSEMFAKCLRFQAASEIKCDAAELSNGARWTRLEFSG